MNKEKIAQYNTQYYQREDIKERIRQNRKEYKRNNYDFVMNAIKISKARRPEYYKMLKVLISERYRSRKANLPDTLTKDEWLFALKYFENRCAVCGKSPQEYPDLYLAADHWIALSDPREDNPGTVATNIIPLCHTKTKGTYGGCNNSKKHKDPKIWLKEKYSEEEVQIILDKIQKYFDIFRNK